MKTWTLDELIEGFRNRNKNALARAITLAESQRSDHQTLVHELLKKFQSPKVLFGLVFQGHLELGNQVSLKSLA